MNEIREVFVKLVFFALQAAFVPILALFIAALFIERVRRALLWIMVVIFVVTMFLAYAVVTHEGVRYDGFEDLWPVLLDSLIKIAPLLVVLLVVGIAAWVASPYLIQAMYGLARRQYLTQALAYSQARAAGFLALESRAGAAQPLKNRRLVTGESGAGKTMLLHHLAAALAQDALDGGGPLPVWVEFDRLLAQQFNLDVPPASLAPLQPIRAPFLERILRRAAEQGLLCFFVDCSASTFTLSNPYEARKKLLRLMQFAAPNAVVVSLPSAYAAADILHQFDEVIALRPLEDAEVVKVLRSQGVKGGATGQLRAAGSAWRGLARRPFILSLLARSASADGRLPADLRELFQRAIYPPRFSPAQVEAGLTRLADEVVRTGQYWLPARRVAQLTGARGLPAACGQNGLLVDLPGQAGAWLTGFGHPLYLAYFIAIGWYQTGQISADLQTLQANPLLADALVFFNHLDADARRFSGQLLAIARQADPGALELVAQCLTAMPLEARPPEVIEQVCVTLLRSEAFAAGGEVRETAWTVLRDLTPPERAALYAKALAGLAEDHQVRVLEQLAVLSRGAASRAGDLPAILTVSGRELGLAAVKAWGAVYPNPTLDEVCALYQQGMAEQQALALELLGGLPHEAAEAALRDALTTETRPEMRVQILQSLANHAPKGLFALLLGVVMNAAEPEVVRAEAARLLHFSDLPEPPDEIAPLRDLVRAARMPLPPAAQGPIRELVEQMRRRFGDQVTAFESLANPFFTNRPVTDPAMFFGRRALLHALLSAVENGGHVWVHGERRIGKSSLLRQLEIGVRDAARKGLPWRCLYLPIDDFDAQEFFYSLMASILAALDDPRLPPEPGPALPYNAAAFQQDLALPIQQIRASKGSGARLVLLLDGADRLLTFPPALTEAFRRVINSDALAPTLVVMLAAGRSLPADHPLSSAFTAYPVPRLEPAEAEELITHPLEGLLAIDPAAVTLIQQSAQGHPQAIQALCQKLVNQVQARGAERITAAEVRLLIEAEGGAAAPRAALIEQVNSLLGDLMDWVEANPNAPNPLLEAQMKRAFDGLREAMIRQVVRLRKAKP